MTIQDRDIEASPADRHTIVGVLGCWGMGPDATVAFMQRVIDATPAEDDIDHVHLLVDNNPKVPSRIKARGADVLVLACTELSVIKDALDASVPVVDNVQILAEQVVAAAEGTDVPIP
jgi:aspartate/glutamate racemase